MEAICIHKSLFFYKFLTISDEKPSNLQTFRKKINSSNVA